MGCLAPSPEQTQAVQGKQPESRSDLNAAVDLVQHQFSMEEGLGNMLDLHFSCSNLPNMDTLSKTDPFVVVYLQTTSKEWKEVGRTEHIYDTLDPKFVTSVPVKFLFEERQPIRIEVWDVDDADSLPKLSSQELVGIAELQIHEICRSADQTITKPLVNPKVKKNGDITIWGDQQTNRPSSNIVKLNIQGRGFPSGKKMFFTLSRSREIDGGEYVLVFKSEIGKLASNYMYKWKLIKIGAAVLIKDDPGRMVRIELFEYKPNGSHKSLGKQDYTFQSLLMTTTSWNVPAGGTVVIADIDIEIRNSFLDFIFGGCDIKLIAAIDFTMSNGDPSLPTSLHYYDPNSNQYIRAIKAVTGILECYDTDKLIPGLGFGARLPPYTASIDCFSLNGNIFDPHVLGTQSLLATYQNALTKVKFAGPTNFSSIIRFAADMAEAYYTRGKLHNYFILLILTDGMIMDFDETAHQIVRASAFPLSIVIVGVGDEDFSEMDKLDADETPLYSRYLKKYMERDIVQFVPYNEFKNSPEELARQTLGEIPKQLVDYMSVRQIQPLPPGGEAGEGFDYYETKRMEMREQLRGSVKAEELEKALMEGYIPTMEARAASAFASGQYPNPLAPMGNSRGGQPGGWFRPSGGVPFAQGVGPGGVAYPQPPVPGGYPHPPGGYPQPPVPGNYPPHYP